MTNAWVVRLWDWIDERSVVRRLMLGGTFWMIWRTTEWAMSYALASKLDGLGTAAVMGAVTAPITALMGYVFKVYADSRNESGSPETPASTNG